MLGRTRLSTHRPSINPCVSLIGRDVRIDMGRTTITCDTQLHYPCAIIHDVHGAGRAQTQCRSGLYRMETRVAGCPGDRKEGDLSIVP